MPGEKDKKNKTESQIAEGQMNVDDLMKPVLEGNMDGVLYALQRIARETLRAYRNMQLEKLRQILDVILDLQDRLSKIIKGEEEDKKVIALVYTEELMGQRVFLIEAMRDITIYLISGAHQQEENPYTYHI